jgi:hypothetical protein
MTNVTLPAFVENIEKGFIIVGDTFIDAAKIVLISKTETYVSIRFTNGYADFEGAEAVEFLNKYNQFLK